ncbi:MAG: TrkA C-terminal domain-containing protein [Sporichthyaceae bacterium]
MDLVVGSPSLFELGTDLLQIRVVPGSRLHGVHVAELRLPPGSVLGALVRDGQTVPVESSTQLLTGDALLFFADPEHRLAVEQRIRAVHRSGRLARWLGDTGR